MLCEVFGAKVHFEALGEQPEDPTIFLVTHGDPSNGQSPCSLVEQLADQNVRVIVMGEMENPPLTDCSELDVNYTTSTLVFDSPDEYERNIVDIQKQFPYPPIPTPFDGFFLFDSVVDGSAQYSPSRLW